MAQRAPDSNRNRLASGAFGDDALLFGLAYLLVRLLHVALSVIVARDDPDRWSALVRFAPTALLGPVLLVLPRSSTATSGSRCGCSPWQSTTSARS